MGIDHWIALTERSDSYTYGKRTVRYMALLNTSVSTLALHTKRFHIVGVHPLIENLVLLVAMKASKIRVAAATDMIRLYRSKHPITNLCQCEFDMKQNINVLHHLREDAFRYWMAYYAKTWR